MSLMGWIEWIGKGVDVAGVAAIILGILYATLQFLRNQSGEADRAKAVYHHYRQSIGRALLLGLELLVAADIIRTVAIEPTFQNLGVLALLVVIRTFLSWTLEMEISGRWPWQRSDAQESLSANERPETR